MDYQQALQYLKDLTKFGFNFGLDRIKKLLELLGNPEQQFKSIHIGGTNGKGSVCAYCSSVLIAAGYKTGLFTSPHLHSYTERIRINGNAIAKEELASYIEKLKPLLDEMLTLGYEHPTEFEVITALAFKYFADQKVDVAVIEVGLGGAIDSTNVITPEVSVITNVSIDHVDYLGPTISEIARVKAGIIKPEIPCVTAARGDAYRVITERCFESKAPLITIGKDIKLISANEQADGTVLQYEMQNLTEDTLPAVKTHLIGDHQRDNCAVALATLLMLRKHGFNITDQALKAGIEETSWYARLEVISKEPFILIDAAHNHAGAKVLAKALSKLLKQKAVFVLGILSDKERIKIIEELLPHIERVIITKPNSPRATNWQELKEVFLKKGVKTETEESITNAVDQALLDSLPVVITGSIYMVAEARAHLLHLEQE